MLTILTIKHGNRTVGVLRTCLFHPLLACSIIWLSTLAIQPAWAVDEKAPPLEAFKSFIASPPIVERIVYEVLPPVELPKDATASVRQIFLARWQTNGFFFREFQNTNDLDQDQTATMVSATGRYDDFYWTYSEDQGLKTYARTPETLAGERTNGVYQTYLADLDRFSIVMNMGIPNQDIGSIHWEGNSFSQTNRFDTIWKGELVPEGIEPPKGMSLANTVIKQGKTYHPQIFYKYDSSLQLLFLPSILEFVEISDTGFRETNSFSILSLQTSMKPLNREQFLYNSYKMTNTKLTVYTNNTLMVQVNGKLELVQHLTTQPQRRGAAFWIIICFICMPIPVLVLVKILKR